MQRMLHYFRPPRYIGALTGDETLANERIDSAMVGFGTTFASETAAR